MLAGTKAADRITHLGAILAGQAAVARGTRAFLNVGLAGTEAWLLNDMCRL